MASNLGLIAGLSLARTEGVPEADVFRIALTTYFLGLTPISIIVTQALARNAVPPPPPIGSPPVLGGTGGVP